MRDHLPPLSAAELSRFAGKRVLITGAGGYLGSALARQLAGTQVAHLTLLDLAEHGLYRLDQRLHAQRERPTYSLVVGDVGDHALLEEVFTDSLPDIVFHAAARKHVPLMEENLFAAAETNVLGTLALVEAAERFGTESFVLLSTDKAVAPISVMGATKRIAEQSVLAARGRQHGGTNFTCLRLCNVLGSTGSVAPLFARQMATGGPITVTHPEATRFFLSRHDAVRHLLRTSLAVTQSGLLVPQPHDALRVEDLAHFLLARNPLSQGAIAITYTGLRAADKLHEQLFGEAETVAGSPYAGAAEITSPFNAEHLESSLPVLAEAVASRDRQGLLHALGQLVPDYHAVSALETA